MKAKCVSKISVLCISLMVILMFAFIPGLEAQILNVAVEHEVSIPHPYEFFEISILANSYFEIVFDILESGGRNVQIKLAAGQIYEDVMVDGNTMVYFLGDDSYDPFRINYELLGTDWLDDVQVPPFTGLFFLSIFKDVEAWETYNWNPGGEITKITILSEDQVRIAYIHFMNAEGELHPDSQNFGSYFDLTDAGWVNLTPVTGAPIISTDDGTLYLRSYETALPDKDMDGFTDLYDCDDLDPASYPGAPEICDGKDNNCDGIIPANESDADGDGFMVCEGDCNDKDRTVYPGATGTHAGKDNNCNGILETSEKKAISVTPSLKPYQFQYGQSSIQQSYMKNLNRRLQQRNLNNYLKRLYRFR